MSDSLSIFFTTFLEFISWLKKIRTELERPINGLDWSKNPESLSYRFLSRSNFAKQLWLVNCKNIKFALFSTRSGVLLTTTTNFAHCGSTSLPVRRSQKVLVKLNRIGPPNCKQIFSGGKFFVALKVAVTRYLAAHFGRPEPIRIRTDWSEFCHSSASATWK
jgi:hypothetical protein